LERECSPSKLLTETYRRFCQRRPHTRARLQVPAVVAAALVDRWSSQARRLRVSFSVVRGRECLQQSSNFAMTSRKQTFGSSRSTSGKRQAERRNVGPAWPTFGTELNHAGSRSIVRRIRGKCHTRSCILKSDAWTTLDGSVVIKVVRGPNSGSAIARIKDGPANT